MFRLSQSVLQGFTCAAANEVEAERFQELAKVMKKKNVKLGEDQVSSHILKCHIWCCLEDSNEDCSARANFQLKGLEQITGPGSPSHSSEFPRREKSKPIWLGFSRTKTSDFHFLFFLLWSRVKSLYMFFFLYFLAVFFLWCKLWCPFSWVA